jgi:hypothetical protein
MGNCLSVVVLESMLLYMKNKFKVMKKSSSGIDLLDMENDLSDS